MTKKDFELIASIICLIEKNRDTFADNEEISNTFASELLKKYPKFNKNKFLLACGVKIDKIPCKSKTHHKQKLLNGFCFDCLSGK